MSRFYVTTPIYYLNGPPHIGHAYTTIAADVATRWNRLSGRDAFMLTGTDEHGQKVFRSAQARGVSPQQHVDELTLPFQALLERVQITHRDFIRTTEERHIVVVKAVLQHLFDRGEIYADDYEGWYSTSAERFWTEKDLVDGKCPDSGQAVEWIKERNYFFRMSKYADQLRTHIEENPDFIRPAARKREVLGYLRKEVGDLCISRPKSRLAWGIPLPFDEDYVTYVWFDALLNYISVLGYHPDPAQRGPDFDQYWPADVHLVGKDILTTHAVYWSTMLFALGLQPTRCLYAHGWWTMAGEKISKSLGNTVDPFLLADAYGVDALRYHLMREIQFGGDGTFSHETFLLRYNADLANDLGNLAHRALSMTGKWLGSVVPALDAPTASD
ncbi:MAG: methionine--tRNA ligase, partial [Myxococcota bacterium]|nr:methionine--tRNA ligase [Myxococcota bacterium]